MAAKAVMAGALVLALAGCNVRMGARDLGKPVAPSAANPTGSVGGSASGGGVPVPVRPGGSGGVGGGGPPGVASGGR